MLVIEVATVTTDQRPPPALQAAVSRLRIDLEPLHPRTTNPSLAGWYTVRLRPEQHPTEVLSALRALPIVTAAYEKPEDAAP